MVASFEQRRDGRLAQLFLRGVEPLDTFFWGEPAICQERQSSREIPQWLPAAVALDDDLFGHPATLDRVRDGEEEVIANELLNTPRFNTEQSSGLINGQNGFGSSHGLSLQARRVTTPQPCPGACQEVP